MPMVWDDAAIAKLCCGILATTDVKIDYKKLAEYMGPECTHRAVEFQVQKMKKAEKASGPASAPCKSSRKRKAIKEASVDSADATGTSSKKAKKSMNKGYDNDDVGDEA